MITQQRTRSGAKANIWDVQITPEDAVRFILAVERSNKEADNRLNEQHFEQNPNDLELNYGSLKRRRNAIANIWEAM